MRFDDRLLTVLNLPAGDRHDSAVRWRQLVDLVARAGANSASPTVSQALEAIRAEAPKVDEGLRAAAARAVSAFPVPLGLLEYFASDRLSVSAPVLAAATLDADQWKVLLGVADAETRRFIEALHPELKGEAKADLTDSLVEAAPLPPDPGDIAPAPAAPPELPPLPEPPATSQSLQDVVARIERRRRSRAAARQPAPLAQPPEGLPALFRWECGPGGEIAWVEGAPRGPLIGRSIAKPHEVEGDLIDPDVVRAFAMRAPFRDSAMTLAGEGLIAGEWKISGVPAFEPADGRFAGYRGIALREHAPAVTAAQSPDLLADPDSLRELVHEIKTPLNAIIGFAEIIEGQFLGPADRRYRERAMEIVQQARLLLTAIDDLDFAAKIHSAQPTAEPRIDLGELVERMAPSLREIAAERGVEIEATRTVRNVPAQVEPELAARLVFRMCSILIARAGEGERLRLSVDLAGDHCSVALSRPAALQGMGDEELFGSADELMASGFSLRLVRGLARIASGDLVGTPAAVALRFRRV